MKYPAQIFPHPTAFSDHIELYKRVFEQLQKDFYPYLSDQKLEPISSDAIFLVMEKIVHELISSYPDRLQQILYRVDLRQHELDKCFSNGLLQADQLIVSIVKREALKVWLRANPT